MDHQNHEKMRSELGKEKYQMAQLSWNAFWRDLKKAVASITSFVQKWDSYQEVVPFNQQQNATVRKKSFSSQASQLKITYHSNLMSKMIEKMQFHQKGQQKCINFSFLLQNWKMSRIYKIAILGAKIQSSIKFIKENKSYLISYQFVTNTQKYKKNSSNHYKITCWNKLNKLDRRFSLLPLQLGILGLTEDLTPAPPKNSSSSTLLAHRRRKQQRVLKSSV